MVPSSLFLNRKCGKVNATRILSKLKENAGVSGELTATNVRMTVVSRSLSQTRRSNRSMNGPIYQFVRLAVIGSGDPSHVVELTCPRKFKASEVIAANMEKMKLVIILLEISNIYTFCIEIHGDSMNIN